MAMDDARGLIRNKYLVYKTQGKGDPTIDIVNRRREEVVAQGWIKRTWSFVLSPAKRDEYGDASRNALVAYATSIVRKNPALAREIRAYLRAIDEEIRYEAREAHEDGRREP